MKMKRNKMKANVLWALMLVVTILISGVCMPALASGENQGEAGSMPNEDVSDNQSITQMTSDSGQVDSEPEADPTPADETITVKFLNADGTVFLTMTVSSGTLIPKPKTDPSLEGYAFKYWYNAKVGEQKSFNFGPDAVAAEDVTLKAFFAPVQAPEDEKLPEDVKQPEVENLPEDVEQTEVENLTEDAEQPEDENLPEDEEQPEVENLPEDDLTDGEPVDGEPVDGEPVDGEPVDGEPVDGEPVAGEDELLEDELLEADDAELPLDMVERSDLGQARLQIWLDAHEETQLGDTVTVYYDIVNFYGWDYSAQWQRKDADGQWTDIPGANGATYSFTLTEENLTTDWRVRIDVVVPQDVEVDPDLM